MAAIDGYLAELGRALRGPRRVKASLLREARDSLVDASEAYQDAGLAPEIAARRAIDDFGAISRIAPGYQSELALAQGRRTALLVVVCLAVQPAIWNLVSWRAAGSKSLPHTELVGFLDGLVSWLGGLVVATALLAVWALGSGVRRLGAGPRRIRLTGMFAFAVAATFTTTGLLLALSSPMPGTPILTRFLYALVFLILPMTGVAVHGSRCLSTARAASSPR